MPIRLLGGPLLLKVAPSTPFNNQNSVNRAQFLFLGISSRKKIVSRKTPLYFIHGQVDNSDPLEETNSEEMEIEEEEEEDAKDWTTRVWRSTDPAYLLRFASAEVIEVLSTDEEDNTETQNTG